MTASTQHTESAERIARPLIQLAKINGISTSYIDQLGTYVEIRDEVLVSVLAALGVDASTEQAPRPGSALPIRSYRRTGDCRAEDNGHLLLGMSEATIAPKK